MREKKCITVRRRVAIFLMLMAIIMELDAICMPLCKVYAEGNESITEELSEEDKEEELIATADEISAEASAYLENTEAKKVDIDDTVAIATTSVYKDMDYTFLKTYAFGNTNDSLVKVTFRSAQDLQISKDVRLREGNVIKTEGYYEAGDGGNAVYQISSEKEDGSIQLTNGLYAVLLPDIYKDADGKSWVLVNIKQFGASSDGVTASQEAIKTAADYASNYVKENDSIFRGLVYIPSGEYKCTNEVHVNNEEDINIVGDGSSSVLFTDNDYRKEEGYAEHFFQSWNSENLFFGNFRIEAREVDLYHYMRQFTLFECNNVYVYNVDLIIPQETYSSYYFEDKQYSNFCSYTGNHNITVDGCTMVQLSGTYRGANIGILDIWSKGVENITVMNCDLYGNARDEQIGIFSTEKESAYIHNVDFINNTIHSSQLKYTDIIGTRTMCFTLGYTDSHDIDDVRIAGNHFICETDSKFMTFAAIKNCVIEENIIEIVASHSNWGSVFDSSNSDADNVKVRNNEFFLTSVDGNQGKSNFVNGRLTFENNKVFSDTYLSFGFAQKNAIVTNNEIVFLHSVGSLVDSLYKFSGNEVHLYNGVKLDGYGYRRYFAANADASEDAIQITGNTIYDYQRILEARNPFVGLMQIETSVDTIEFSGNTYYAPNKKYTGATQYTESGDAKDMEVTSDNEKIYYERFFRIKSGDAKNIIVKDNVCQGVMGYCGDTTGKTVTLSNNTNLPYREDLQEDEEVVSSIDILYNNKKTDNISVTGDSISLDKIVRVATETDEDGNVTKEKETTEKEVKWYTSVESIATVSEAGVVTRKMYGNVKVYAVATDGSGVYAECTIHFEKNQAKELKMAKSSLSLQPGLKYYADYTVSPEGASQNLLWSSSNEAVATVSKSGTVTAVAVGNAVITGKTTDGSNLSQTIKVHVTPVTVKKIDLNESWIYCENSKIGTTIQLTPSSYTPSNAENKGIGRWESTDTSVVSVDKNGKVTIVGGGVAQIRAYSMDEYCYGECTFYVQTSQVTNLKTTEVTKNSVSLSWDKVATGYGYYLYQWNDSTSQWDILNGGKYFGTDETSYQVTSLEGGTEYKFCVRSFITNWQTGERQVYESKDSIVTVKTYNYQPVTSIAENTTFTVWGLGETGFLYQESNPFLINYSPSTENYDALDFTYKIEDESIAKIEEVTDTGKQGQKKIRIKGLKYGSTYVTVTSNDELHKSVKIPLGVVPTTTIQDCTATGVYNKATIEFSGLEDESNITGYVVQQVIGYRFSDVAYIPKSGAETYSCVDKNRTVGETYQYTVRICLSDGTNYFYGNNGNTASTVIPEPIQATSLAMKEDIYVVATGKTIEASAQLGPEEISTNELYWEVLGGKYASVERIEKNDGEGTVDYAQITGLIAGVTKVKAVTTDGSDKEASATLIVTPQALENVSTKSDLTSIQISWDSCKNADGYYIYRWDEKSGEFVKISDTTENSYTDANLEKNTSYRYKVSAYIVYEDNVYEGAVDNEISVATTAYDFGIYASGYNGYYDGQSHDGVTLQGIISETDTVTYSTDNKNWSNTVPVVKDVKDSKKIYVRVERTGQKEPYCVTVTANVLAASIETADITLNKNKVEWNGKTQNPSIVSATCVEDKDYKVSYTGTFKNAGTYKVTITGIGNYTGTKELNYTIEVIKGHKYKVSGYIYKVTGENTVSVTGITNKKQKTVTIKNTVKIGGKTYKITSIGNNAFKKCKKLTKVTIGKYVTTIGKNAFYGDTKLKKIVIKTTKLKKVGKNAIKGIHRRATIQAPKSKKKKYKKLFKKSTGYVSTMRWK